MRNSKHDRTESGGPGGHLPPHPPLPRRAFRRGTRQSLEKRLGEWGKSVGLEEAIPLGVWALATKDQPRRSSG